MKKRHTLVPMMSRTDVILNDSRMSFSNRAVNRIPKRIEISHKSHSSILPPFCSTSFPPLLLFFSPPFFSFSSPLHVMEW